MDIVKMRAGSMVGLMVGAMIACLSGWSSAQSAQPAPAFRADLAKGRQLAAACAGCHVQDGSRGDPAYPILQGQHREYIYKQLSEYKSGKRVNAIMNGLAATLVTEEDMKNVAAFYESLKSPAGEAKDQDLSALGKRIYKGGIADKAVPACAGCHGPLGSGIPSQYPRLGGQHAQYIEAQLGYFREGKRANNAAMTWISGRLSEKESKSLAEYISGLH